MSTTTSLPPLYVKLLEKFPLRPIRDDAGLDRAIAVVNELVDRGFENLEPEESDYLDVLSDLVHAYEAEHDPLPALRGVDAIRSLMDLHGMTQTKLAAETGLTI